MRKNDKLCKVCYSKPHHKYVYIFKFIFEKVKVYWLILSIFTARFSDFLQEYKGCIIVGIIMLAFVICWLPFFTLVLADTISQLVGSPIHYPEWLFELFIWLGYANSCTNPLIYTMINKDFRQAFRDILTCKCRSMGTRSRYGRYLQQVGNLSTRSNVSSS